MMPDASQTTRPLKDLVAAPSSFVRGWLNARPRHPLINFAVMLAVSLGLWAVAGLVFSRVGEPVTPRSQDKAVTNNLRAIKAAADQYFLEHPGVSSVALTALVGPDSTPPLNSFQTVAHETYSPVIVKGQAVSASGIAGARTITYGP